MAGDDTLAEPAEPAGRRWPWLGLATRWLARGLLALAVVLLMAIAWLHTGWGRQWIAEVNWPLREGPHSPAGRSVSVDEETQADFLARYYLLAAGSGFVERIDWWQLVARGYGLVDPQPDGTLRRRPAFRAFATLRRELAGATCLGPGIAEGGVRSVRFEREGRELLAVWSPEAASDWRAPRALARLTGRDGATEQVQGTSLRVGGSVRYAELAG